MKKTTGHKFKLGLFVTISVSLFILCIYFIGDKQQLFNNTFRISSVFKDISGLQVGNNVRFSGINVGIVENIEQITDTSVRVEMMIDEASRKFMKIDAKATIGSDGLMGNKIVIISPGTSDKKILSENDIILATQAISMDDILLKLKTTADNASIITSDMAAISGSIRQGKGTIGKLLMDSAMSETVDDAMVNIKQGAGGFKRNMDAASHNILLKGYIKKKKKEPVAEKKTTEELKKE